MLNEWLKIIDEEKAKKKEIVSIYETSKLNRGVARPEFKIHQKKYT